MSDEAIVRELERLRIDIKEDFAELRTQLGALLPREVYTAHRDAMMQRLDNVEKAVDGIDARQVASRRWIVSAVVLPVVSILVMIGLTVWQP